MPINPADIMSWLPVVAALIQTGSLTVAAVKAALASAHGETDTDTEAADNAALDELKVYVAQKYGEAVALSHFGE